MKLLETHRGTSLPNLPSFSLCVDLPSRHMMGRFWGTACVSTPQHFLPHDLNIHGQVHLYWHTFQKCFQNHSCTFYVYNTTGEAIHASMYYQPPGINLWFPSICHTALGWGVEYTLLFMAWDCLQMVLVWSIQWIVECNLDIGTTHV